MDTFAVDLDKLLDDFELNEDKNVLKSSKPRSESLLTPDNENPYTLAAETVYKTQTTSIQTDQVSRPSALLPIVTASYDTPYEPTNLTPYQPPNLIDLDDANFGPTPPKIVPFKSFMQQNKVSAVTSDGLSANVGDNNITLPSYGSTLLQHVQHADPTVTDVSNHVPRDVNDSHRAIENQDSSYTGGTDNIIHTANTGLAATSNGGCFDTEEIITWSSTGNKINLHTIPIALSTDSYLSQQHSAVSTDSYLSQQHSSVINPSNATDKLMSETQQVDSMSGSITSHTMNNTVLAIDNLKTKGPNGNLDSPVKLDSEEIHNGSENASDTLGNSKLETEYYSLNTGAIRQHNIMSIHTYNPMCSSGPRRGSGGSGTQPEPSANSGNNEVIERKNVISFSDVSNVEVTEDDLDSMLKELNAEADNLNTKCDDVTAKSDDVTSKSDDVTLASITDDVWPDGDKTADDVTTTPFVCDVTSNSDKVTNESGASLKDLTKDTALQDNGETLLNKSDGSRDSGFIENNGNNDDTILESILSPVLSSVKISSPIVEPAYSKVPGYSPQEMPILETDEPSYEKSSEDTEKNDSLDDVVVKGQKVGQKVDEGHFEKPVMLGIGARPKDPALMKKLRPSSLQGLSTPTLHNPKKDKHKVHADSTYLSQGQVRPPGGNMPPAMNVPPDRGFHPHKSLGIEIPYNERMNAKRMSPPRKEMSPHKPLTMNSPTRPKPVQQLNFSANQHQVDPSDQNNVNNENLVNLNIGNEVTERQDAILSDSMMDAVDGELSDESDSKVRRPRSLNVPSRQDSGSSTESLVDISPSLSPSIQVPNANRLSRTRDSIQGVPMNLNMPGIEQDMMAGEGRGDVSEEMGETTSSPGSVNVQDGRNKEGLHAEIAQGDQVVTVEVSEPDIVFSPPPPGPTPGPGVEFNQHALSELGKVAPMWVPDADAQSCMKCEVKFTFTRRRHHCRACGNVFCSNCCNSRCKLQYMGQKEARVCQTCHHAILQAAAYERMVTPGQSKPDPNNPADYCSTVSPLDQARHDTPPPSVLVPVLKREGSKNRERKSVMFSDGIRPGGDLTELDGTVQPQLPVPKKPVRTHKKVERQPPDGAAGDNESTCRPARIKKLNISELERDPSLLPDDGIGLPPFVKYTADKGEYSLEDVGKSQEDILNKCLDPEADPVTFALCKNLFVLIKIISLDCCLHKTCWSFTTKGMCTVGQDEMVILLECLHDENSIPRDVLWHLNSVYQEASKGTTVGDLGYTIFTERFLGTNENSGFLYIRPTFQCLQKLILPQQPYLFGLLLQKWETPWAKVFPTRLMLRLGAELRYYPCPLVSIRDRKPVYAEIGHTIINLLADFRNFQYMLPQIKGVTIHMQDKRTTINFPRNRYNEIMKVLNSSNDHVLSLGACFSMEADSHLVCIQNDEGSYQTQAINIQNKPREVTGASFVVFNGALKSSSGLTAKSSIVEDGLMLQIPPETMIALKQAIHDMKDYVIGCGPTDAPQPDERVTIHWTDDDKKINPGVKSPIDNMSLEGVEVIHIHNSTDYIGEVNCIRWTEVYFIINQEIGDSPYDPTDLSRLAEKISTAGCIALTPHLEKLQEASLTRIGLRVTLDSEHVGYECGSNGNKLPPFYMNDLDNELIAVIHNAAGQTRGGPVVMELVFHIMQ